METLPEYIEGIPTEKRASRERREIIKRENSIMNAIQTIVNT